VLQGLLVDKPLLQFSLYLLFVITPNAQKGEQDKSTSDGITHVVKGPTQKRTSRKYRSEIIIPHNNVSTFHKSNKITHGLFSFLATANFPITPAGQRLLSC
jgi:hypothetical protein